MGGCEVITGPLQHFFLPRPLITTILSRDVLYVLQNDTNRIMWIFTARHDFQVAHDVSAYSLIAVARAAAPYLDKESSSITAVTFAGSIWVRENSFLVYLSVMDFLLLCLTLSLQPVIHPLTSVQAVPNYNIMGPAKVIAKNNEYSASLRKRVGNYSLTNCHSLFRLP